MPHPHEQKLHAVVNSLTFASFISRVAAFTALTSISPSRLNAAPPPAAILSQALRFTVEDRGALPPLFREVEFVSPIVFAPGGCDIPAGTIDDRSDRLILFVGQVQKRYVIST
jgi:hypothetical protein